MLSAAIKTNKSSDLGNLSLVFLSAVAMARIRITNLCLLVTSRETGIMRFLSNGAPIVA